MRTDDYVRLGLAGFLAAYHQEIGTFARSVPANPVAEQLERERVEIESQMPKPLVLCPWGIGDVDADPYA